MYRRLVNSSTETTPSPGPSTPVSERRMPVPRARISVPPSSPMSPASRAVVRLFDWEAAKGAKPPPYASPAQNARVRALRQSYGGAGLDSPSPQAKRGPRRVVRKRGLIQRIKDLPGWIAFELSLFPHNVPLPDVQTSARFIAVGLHILHFLVDVQKHSQKSTAEVPWDQPILGGSSKSFDLLHWTTLLSALLFLISAYNTLRLFTSTRIYRLHLRKDPVASPNAKFVPADLVNNPPEPSTRIYIAFVALWRFLKASFMFLFDIKPKKKSEIAAAKTVQQLEVWTPSDFELVLFTLYSPIHSLIWMASGLSFTLGFLLTGVSLQIHAVILSYQALLKDRMIISSEVLHEYEEKFVSPRLNYTRTDKAVMTHEAEVVDRWK